MAPLKFQILKLQVEYTKKVGIIFMDDKNATSLCSKNISTLVKKCLFHSTGKSLPGALIFASINPQYDNRLFIELP